MAKRKKSGCGCLTIIIIFLIMGFCGLIGQVINEENTKKAQKYHDAMAVLENPSSVSVTGEKAVAYLENKRGAEDTRMFCTEYVPEGYTTENPEEVRYILYCCKDSDFIGTYSNGGGVGKTPWVEIQILDRTINKIIASQKFVGGYPPSTVSSGGTHYGSEPDSAEIESWILSVFNGHVTVSAKVPAGWYAPGCWAWSSVDGVDAFDAWPGEAMASDGGWYTIQVPFWINYVIINANDGTVQTADLPVETGRDLWVVVNDAGEAEVYYENPDA